MHTSIWHNLNKQINIKFEKFFELIIGDNLLSMAFKVMKLSLVVIS